LAPLQFFAVIVQWALHFLNETQIFAVLTLIVTILMIIVNIVFQIWFSKNFNAKKIPADIERRIRLDKM
jgi:uncharacterized protein YqgC (DUF456 family)